MKINKIVLIALLILGSAALYTCGSDSSPTADNSDGSQSGDITQGSIPKIILLLPLSGSNSEKGNKIKEGVSKVLSTNTSSLKLLVEDMESNQNILVDKFKTAWQDPDVIAVVCQTSDAAFAITANPEMQDLLVVAVTASSTMLEGIKNLVLMAPSNRLQSDALFTAMNKQKVKHFAVVFETNVYSMDLVSHLYANTFAANHVKLEQTPPKLLASFPVNNTDLPINSLVSLREQEKLDTIVYLGFQNDFFNLVTRSLKNDIMKDISWFGGDALVTGELLKRLNNALPDLPPIHAMGLGTSGNDLWEDFGTDTGNFLLGAIEAIRAEKQEVNRANVLKKAKSMQYEGMTGVKGSQDESGWYDIYRPVNGKWQKLE